MRCSLLLVLVSALMSAPLYGQDGGLETLGALQTTLAKAADRVAPSVVMIMCERDRTQDRAANPSVQRRLTFGRQAADGYFQRPGAAVTGVVISDDGLIATAGYNVAGKLRKIWVVGADGRKRSATLLGSDPNIDLRLIKVEDHAGLRKAEFADSEAMVPGRMVALVSRSVASDSGVDVAFGIVSAVDRKRKQAMQISTRMNYGNVGGAVIDLEGRVVAIAAHLSNASSTGQNSGVGFAAPIHMLNSSRDVMVSGKDIPRIKSPFLGVRGSREQAEGEKGVKIQEVLKGMAAERSGLKNNDVILIFNGVEINDFMTLAEEIGKLSVGDEILVTVRREGWEKDFRIKVGARPAGDE